MTEDKRKVLLVVPMLDQGGLEKVCVMTARLLSVHCDVTIAVFNGEGIVYDVSGLDVVDFKLPSRNSFLGKLVNVYLRTRKLKKIKKERDINISYGFGPTASISNALAKVNDKVYSGLRSYLDLQNMRRMDFYCMKSDGIICCSTEIAKRIEMRYPQKAIHTLHNPYNIDEIKRLSEEFSPEIPYKNSMEIQDEKIIVSMGRENDVKGFWHLFKAFSLVKKAGWQVRLMIIGAGDFKEYVQLSKELGIWEDVFFAGVHQNPYPYLQSAGIYVLSSLNEGFPNALVEAMALGIPVVATNCKTGPAEILLSEYKELELDTYVDADYGILVPELSGEKNLDASDIEEGDKILAEAIVSLLEDSGKYEHYQNQALLRAKDFSSELYVEKLMKIVKE